MNRLSRVLDEGDQNIERPSNQTKDPQKSRKMLEIAKKEDGTPKLSTQELQENPGRKERRAPQHP